MTFHDSVREFNREKDAEAGIALGVGIVSCVIVFAVVFWLGWLFAMLILGLDSNTGYFGLGVAVVFLALSVWYVWRQVDPISSVDLNYSPEEQAFRDLEVTMGFHLGVPVFRRESLAWLATIFVGGPANIFDAFAIRKARLNVPFELARESERLLESCTKGIPFDSVEDKRAVVLLHRLALVKAVRGPDGRMLLMPTKKGLAAIGDS